MNISVHTLHWDNADPRIVTAHKKVFDSFNIPVIYTSQNLDHGSWLSAICKNSTADVAVFFDIDCVPLSRKAIFDCAEYARKNKTFIGTAQAANHLHPYIHTYASPAFMAMSLNGYKELGEPYFNATEALDVAENVSYVAYFKKHRYRCLYPTLFDLKPNADWALTNYGRYGIGTLFSDKVYHLYQGRYAHRFPEMLDLFERRCDQIVEGKFTTDGMHSCTDLNI